MPFSSWSNSCECGKSLESDTDEYHLLTCNTGGGPVYTHNSIVRITSVYSTKLRKLEYNCIGAPSLNFLLVVLSTIHEFYSNQIV